MNDNQQEECQCFVCRTQRDKGLEVPKGLYDNIIEHSILAAAPSNIGPSSPIKKSPHSFSDLVKYLKEDNDAVFRWDETEVRIRFDGVNLKYDRRGSVSNLIVTTDILNGVFFLEHRTIRNEKILRLVEDSFESLDELIVYDKNFTTNILNNLKEIKSLILEDLK